jgi:hypothetical protein
MSNVIQGLVFIIAIYFISVDSAYTAVLLDNV